MREGWNDLAKKKLISHCGSWRAPQGAMFYQRILTVNSKCAYDINTDSIGVFPLFCFAKQGIRQEMPYGNIV